MEKRKLRRELLWALMGLLALVCTTNSGKALRVARPERGGVGISPRRRAKAARGGHFAITKKYPKTSIASGVAVVSISIALAFLYSAWKKRTSKVSEPIGTLNEEKPIKDEEKLIKDEESVSENLSEVVQENESAESSCSEN